MSISTFNATDRLIEGIRCVDDPRGGTIREQREVHWGLLIADVVGCGLLFAVLEPNDVPVICYWILGGLSLIVAAFAVSPLNQRITIDRRSRTCLIASRWFCVPYRRRTVALCDAGLAPRDVDMAHTIDLPDSGPSGGLIVMLIELVTGGLRNVMVASHPMPALVHYDDGGQVNVIAVFVYESDRNTAFDAIARWLPQVTQRSGD
ncbi:MAG: hypothetical protein GC159_06535 [Phycisphaera sp.]|nr:hypothetical protein [Phycisphaera sp.]